jgi:hypothetical protein
MAGKAGVLRKRGHWRQADRHHRQCEGIVGDDEHAADDRQQGGNSEP